MDEVKRKAIETLKLVTTDVISTAVGTALIDLGASRASVVVQTTLGTNWAHIQAMSDIKTGPFKSKSRSFTITLSEQQVIEGE